MNPTEIYDALDKVASAPFDPVEFPFAFAEATDNARATISKLRNGSTNKSDIAGGVLLHRKFHYAPAPLGEFEAVLDRLRASRRTAAAKPAILLTTTSFTKILVVLGLTRNALGLQQTPPNQVLAGLALFLSLFIMAPVLSDMNHDGLQPYLDGDKSTSQAWDDGIAPLRDFMIDHTGDEELQLLTSVADRDLPKDRADVPMSTLVPAFVLSELKQAFIIGFIIFIPFLVIDIVVSGSLMALGMMMMPPVMVSLPFKLLLFVMVDGWALVIKSLVASYGSG